MHGRRPTNEERAEALVVILLAATFFAFLCVPPHAWGFR